MLADKIYQQVVAVSKKGNQFFDNKQYQEAIEVFEDGLELIPEPQEEYEASGWFLSSIGDCYFAMGQYQEALDNFLEAKKCEEGSNAFVWLRIGQCSAELNNMGKAIKFMKKAYEVEGKGAFSDENPKYWALIEKEV